MRFAGKSAMIAGAESCSPSILNDLGTGCWQEGVNSSFVLVHEGRTYQLGFEAPRQELETLEPELKALLSRPRLHAHAGA